MGSRHAAPTAPTVITAADDAEAALHRYPARHKDELERQCRVMEEQGLIRRNKSRFIADAIAAERMARALARSIRAPSRANIHPAADVT